MPETFGYIIVVTIITAVRWKIYSPCESHEFRTRGETRLDVGRCTGAPGSWSTEVRHAAKQAGVKASRGVEASLGIKKLSRRIGKPAYYQETR